LYIFFVLEVTCTLLFNSNIFIEKYLFGVIGKLLLTDY